MVQLYIFHYIINPIIILFLGRIIYGKIRYFSFPAIFLIFYFLTHYIRAVNVFENNYNEWNYLISIWVIPYLFLFGVAISLMGWRHSPIKIRNSFLKMNVSKLDLSFIKYVRLISIFLLLLPIIFILDKGINSVPIFYLFSNPGDSIQSMHLRLEGLNSNISPVLTIVYSYSRAFLYPLYMGILTLLYMNRIIKRKHLILVAMASVLFASMTASKAPTAVILFSIALSYYFGTKEKTSKLKVLLGMFLSVFIPALIYPLMYGSSAGNTFIVAVEGLWRRISLVPSMTSALYFSIFRTVEKSGFASNRIMAFIFNQDYTPHASFVYNYIAGDSIFHGGLVNASYMASFYADWGTVGVIFGTLLVGLFVGQIQVFYDRFHNDIVGTGFKAFTMIGMMYLMLSNFYSAALGRGFISAPLLLILFAYKKGFYKNKALDNNR